MTIDLPVLRLGLAGFSADQQRQVQRLLVSGIGEGTILWEPGDIEGADAWWVNGSQIRLLGGDRIRVASAVPSERAVQFHMPDIDRPLAFARPLPAGFDALCSFDLASRDSMAGVLQQFEGWLAPLVAQFCLASHIVEHQSALGSGLFELRLDAELLAVVDMHGEAAVRATARPDQFEEAIWRRSAAGCVVPEHFARCSLSELMWQFAVRSQRDVLPKHYRTGLIYFRRAPRLPQRLLKDAHLLVMRELLLEPATFADLQQRCGMPAARLARELSALYLVGSITSNPKRAARTGVRADGDASSSFPSNLPSGLDSVAPGDGPPRPRPGPRDLTAPAPLRPDH